MIDKVVTASNVARMQEQVDALRLIHHAVLEATKHRPNNAPAGKYCITWSDEPGRREFHWFNNYDAAMRYGDSQPFLVDLVSLV